MPAPDADMDMDKEKEMDTDMEKEKDMDMEKDMDKDMDMDMETGTDMDIPHAKEIKYGNDSKHGEGHRKSRPRQRPETAEKKSVTPRGGYRNPGRLLPLPAGR